jgi:hypothetical protein
MTRHTIQEELAFVLVEAFLESPPKENGLESGSDMVFTH